MRQTLPTSTVNWKILNATKGGYSPSCQTRKEMVESPWILAIYKLTCDKICAIQPPCVYNLQKSLSLKLECSIQQLAPTTMFLFSLTTPESWKIAKTYQKSSWNEQGYAAGKTECRDTRIWRRNTSRTRMEDKATTQKTIQTFSLQIQVTHPLNLSIRTENS